MKTSRFIWFIFTLLIFQSSSCNQNFKKHHLSKNEIWWNELNGYWKELMLRETDHLGDKINEQILNEIFQLKSFDADHYPVYDLSPVEKLTQLESLSAGSTQISDLKPIENLTKLKSLNFPATPVYDLTPLKNLKELEEVYIQQTLVKDISPLNQAKDLQVLVMHGTDVTSLQAIMHMDQLSILDISELKIPQTEIDEFISSHPQCEIIK